MPNPHATHWQIVPFDAQHAAAFKALNLQWLEDHALLEAEDLKYLDHPQETIIETGGQIYVGLKGGDVVGTCAVARVSETDWELLKLAVHRSERGRGLGR